MILYNVTVKIDRDVEAQWLKWMLEDHIPAVLATGLFRDNKVFRMLGAPEEDGVTYSFQYTLDSLADLQQYSAHHAPALQADHQARYRDRFVAFRSYHELVSG